MNEHGESIVRLPSVTVTADGAARGNPGPGGWAALLEANGRERLLHGEGPDVTTNNAMEIYAVTQALQALKKPCAVLLRLDSQYVINGLERLLNGGKLPEKNRDLWAQLREAAQPHQIRFEWVRGHAGDRRNEQVDRAANAASNRAFLATQRAAAVAPDAAAWTLALLSPGSDRPARWALITPTTRRNGEVALRRGITQPTLMYEALLAGITAASELPGAAAAPLRVASNYELIIKQGRGEWKVKNPAQRELAKHVDALRSEFGDVQYAFANTAEVTQLLQNAAVTK